VTKDALTLATELRAFAKKLTDAADVLDPAGTTLETPSSSVPERIQRGVSIEDLWAADAAPYGYKADGTPRRRPAPSPETQAKIAAIRKARRQPEAPAAETVTLRVLSSTKPTPKELEDREVVHVTEAPAG
jgi:hypothetical protein